MPSSSSVQTEWMRIFRGVNLEPKLGRDHHLVTHGSESLAHELFIHERYKWPEYGEMIGSWFDQHPWMIFNAPIMVSSAA